MKARSQPTKVYAFLCVGLLSLLTGCVTQQICREPPMQSPLPFSESGETQPLDRWWQEFGDAGLNFQVEHALGQSFDLAAAMYRLRAAKAVVRREASDLFPDLDGVIGTNTTFGPGPNQTRITWGLDAAYQVDLWGQIQSRVDAERFRADATQADYYTVALSLSAEIARTWFALIEAQAQLDLLNEQLESNRTGLKYQRQRFNTGNSELADVRRQEQLVQSTLEQAIVVRSRAEVLEHQLAVLTGQQPQTASYDPGAALPELPPAPFAGLPSELIMRRPDVRATYLDFLAADRDLASAISARYPRLNVTGSLLNSATNSDNLFRDWFLSLGSQLIAPLFDGGQRRAEVDRTSAVMSQLDNVYRQTTLIAFQEVEDNLALERFQIQRIERLQKQAELAGEAAELLRNRLQIGDGTYLDYLSATQSYQRLQRDTLSARLDLILIRIGLYLAIAGDFDTCPQDVVDLSLVGELIGEMPLEPSAKEPVEPSDHELPADQELPTNDLTPPDIPSRPITRLPPDPALVINE